jgi:hypothetical protein
MARTVSVDPERLARWLDGFAARHDGSELVASPELVTLTGGDGSTARLTVPFPPLVGDLVSHALRDRTVGVLLVRLGGHAAGVFVGTRLEASKVGSRQVHGRNAAGGQSQQRFARRREGQVRVALAAAADNAARVLLPAVASLDALVLGGDRRAITTVLADPRLEPLRPLVSGPVLDVPDPRQRVLLQTPALFRAVRIDLD